MAGFMLRHRSPAGAESSGSIRTASRSCSFPDPNIVGLAFLPSRALAVCTSNALYRVDVNIAGKPLP